MQASDSSSYKKVKKKLTKNFSVFGIFCHKIQHTFGLHYLLINDPTLVRQEDCFTTFYRVTQIKIISERGSYELFRSQKPLQAS